MKGASNLMNSKKKRSAYGQVLDKVISLSEQNLEKEASDFCYPDNALFLHNSNRGEIVESFVSASHPGIPDIFIVGVQ